MPGVSEKEIITIVLVGSFITLLVVAFLVSFVYFYQRRHFEFLREKQNIRSQFQEELLKTRLEIQEETFRMISEEIHDNIGQTLSFIKLNMNMIQVNVGEPDKEKWQESTDLMTKVIQDLRNLSRTLNTDFIQHIGLAAAVKQQLDLLERTGLYSTSLEVKGEKKEFPVNRELVLFRVIQELLNNIVKHADASLIKTCMTYETGRLLIKIEDNGKGFDTANVSLSEKTGIGLRNVINRVSLINGTITINSLPGKGTCINIELPQTNDD